MRKKRLISVLLAAVMLLAALPAVTAQEYPRTGWTTASLRLRKSASDSGDILLVIPAGDALLISGETGDYYIAEYEGTAGYVIKSFITFINPNGETNTASAQALENYTALKSGSSGAAVRALQQALEELGFFSDTVDGKFGGVTEAAVLAFQEKNSLTATGIADAATQELLFEGSPRNSSGTRTEVHTLPPIDGYTIRSGDRGDAVAALQQALKNLGYYDGEPDGVCGSGTVKAIKKFQEKNGLSADGAAGLKTQTVLYGPNAVSSASTATPVLTATAKPTATPVVTPTPALAASYPYTTVTTDSVNLRKRASTNSTRILTVPSGASVTVQSVSGDFLYILYKTYSGYVLADYVSIPEQYLPGGKLEADAEAQADYKALAQGSSGTLVRALQQALTELGFYSGTVDGQFGSGTLSAVKAFQKKNELAQSGIATPELQQFIYEGKPLNSRGTKTEITTLPPIEGYTMRFTDSGDAVTALQQKLISLGYLAASANGVYDAVTESAVKAFQRAAGLSADGIAGARTQSALALAFATPTPTMPLVVATATPAPITEDNVIVLHSGTRGTAVTRLQERLVALGYYSITPDGIYDGKDLAAVRAFQKANGLVADGVAGYQTQVLLYSGSALPYGVTAAPVTATPAPDTSASLKYGSSGTSVKQMQSRLITLGYLSGSADGIFGTGTASAVTAFQTQNNLTADGIAGAQTLNKLYSSSVKSAASTAKPTPTAAGAATLLKIGDTGSAVKAMQQKLISLGYLSGTADGIFGTDTFLALEKFQKASGLDSDGIAGAATLAKLASASSGSSSTVRPPSTSFTAPDASEVRFANWFTEIRSIARTMPYATVYDFETGLHYEVKMFSFGKHADAEPVTKEDTAVMEQIIGVNNWTPHAVWVILSNGYVYMASTHSHGHEADTNSSNGLSGHICIHFPRELEEAAETGPYALKHQYEILAGWEATQALSD